MYRQRSLTEAALLLDSRYDVTDSAMQACCILTCPIHWVPLAPGVLGTKTFVLEPEEAVFKIDCCICNTETRRPYGELGSVDKVKYGCCIGVGSELSAKMPICPGSGCNEALVDEIVADLKPVVVVDWKALHCARILILSRSAPRFP